MPNPNTTSAKKNIVATPEPLNYILAYNHPLPEDLPIAEEVKIRRPQLFLVEYYQLYTYRVGFSAGDQIKSYQIPANSEFSYSVTTTSSSKQSSEQSSSVLESADSSAQSSFQNDLTSSSNSHHSQDSSTFDLKSNFHGAVDIGLSSGTADADLNVSTSSNDLHSDYGEAAGSALSTQTSNANASRKLNTQNQNAKEETGYSVTAVENRTQKNLTSQTINRAVFQVDQQFLSLLTLVNIGLEFRNGDINQNRSFKLFEIDKVIGTYFKQHGDGELLKNQVRKILENIRDRNDEKVSILKPNETDMVINRNLRTDYEIKNADGTVRRKVSVPGIVIQEYRNALKSPNFTIDIIMSANN